MICCDSGFCPVCQRHRELLTLNKGSGPVRMRPLVAKHRSVLADKGQISVEVFWGLEAEHFISKAAFPNT